MLCKYRSSGCYFVYIIPCNLYSNSGIVKVVIYQIKEYKMLEFLFILCAGLLITCSFALVAIMFNLVKFAIDCNVADDDFNPLLFNTVIISFAVIIAAVYFLGVYVFLRWAVCQMF